MHYKSFKKADAMLDRIAEAVAKRPGRCAVIYAAILTGLWVLVMLAIADRTV